MHADDAPPASSSPAPSVRDAALEEAAAICESCRKTASKYGDHRAMRLFEDAIAEIRALKADAAKGEG